MEFLRRLCFPVVAALFPLIFLVTFGVVSAFAQSSSSSHSAQKSRSAERREAALDLGTLSDGVYRNKALGLTCKIPPGWVLRTEEMNASDEADPADDKGQPQRAQGNTEADKKANGGRVLLAAFSRPPHAKGDEVNSSILIVAESAVLYPGLIDAGQYFEPLTEVAKAQGFVVDEAPYEVAIGTKTLVRGDFHRDVGTRVMQQSTLAWLAHGYAVSITVIGGTDDEVEELVDGVRFGAAAAGKK